MKPQIQPSGKLEREIERIGPEKMKELMANVAAIQLTEGCSIGCKFCGVDAEKGVRDYIPFTVIESIMEMLTQQGSRGMRPLLYYASEPFDYDFDGKTYFDVHRLAEERGKYNPCVITAIPKGKEEIVLSSLLNGNFIDNKDMKTINSLSISPRNFKRIERAVRKIVPEINDQRTMEVMHSGRRFWSDNIFFENQEELLHELGVDTSAEYRIVPSRNAIPNISNPDKTLETHFVIFGSESEQVVVYSVGEPVRALDVLEGIANNASIRYFDIPSINYSRTPLKLGPKNVGKFPMMGIGCFDGTMLTPQGIYTVQTVKPTARHPFGQVVKPFDGRVIRYRQWTPFDMVPYAEDDAKEIRKLEQIFEKNFSFEENNKSFLDGITFPIIEYVAASKSREIKEKKFKFDYRKFELNYAEMLKRIEKENNKR
jgi:hypothetical protein